MKLKTIRVLDIHPDKIADIIARKPMTSHPADTYLNVVLARLRNSEGYVTWEENIEGPMGPSYNHGHYYPTGDIVDAARDYDRRGKVETTLAENLIKLAELGEVWT